MAMMNTGVHSAIFSLHRTFVILTSNLSKQFATSAISRCANEGDSEISVETKGFLKAQKSLRAVLDTEAATSQSLTSPPKTEKRFAELLKESAMVKLGDFSNQTLVGKIIARVNNELYIDYGGKFDCVCRVPQPKSAKWSTSPSGDKYEVGTRVVIRVRDHEMTARFMGYDTDLTLLEADAQLIGPLFGDKATA